MCGVCAKGVRACVPKVVYTDQPVPAQRVTGFVSQPVHLTEQIIRHSANQATPHRSEVRGERPEVRGERSEVRGERSDSRGQRPEVAYDGVHEVALEPVTRPHQVQSLRTSIGTVSYSECGHRKYC